MVGLNISRLVGLNDDPGDDPGLIGGLTSSLGKGSWPKGLKGLRVNILNRCGNCG
jgi:hypothetical protein